MLITYGREIVSLDRLDRDYPDLLNHVLACGDDVPSRIGRTREVLDLRLRLIEPEYCLVDRAGMSDDFAYEELTQLLAGVYDGDRIAAIIPRAAELLATPTAYGPRAWPQLGQVCEELSESPKSRRAVVYIGRDDDLASLRDHNESVARAGEMPCTCVWQFHLRRGELHMTVYMRSWDLVWGLSYDVPSFVAIQMAVARHLGAELGEYTHHAGSGHIYERHFGLKGVRPGHGLLRLDHLLADNIFQTQVNARAALSYPGVRFNP